MEPSTPLFDWNKVSVVLLSLVAKGTVSQETRFECKNDADLLSAVLNFCENGMVQAQATADRSSFTPSWLFQVASKSIVNAWQEPATIPVLGINNTRVVKPQLTGPFSVVEHGEHFWVADNGFRIACMLDIGNGEGYANAIADALNKQLATTKLYEALEMAIVFLRGRDTEFAIAQQALAEARELGF